MNPKIIPNLSVDCVVFGFEANTKSLNVLLIKRYLKTSNILINDYVLTGYHVLENETLDESAARILKELTGLDNLYKEQFKCFGNPNRLMNEKDIIWAKHESFNLRTFTIAYYFLLRTNEVDIENNKYNPRWFSMDNLPQLGFDHKDIINEAYSDLKQKSIHSPVVFELLPDKFTIKELQDIYESVLGVEIDNRNFRRKIISKEYIIKIDEKQFGNTKKPSQLYMFSRDIYNKISRKGYLINI